MSVTKKKGQSPTVLSKFTINHLIAVAQEDSPREMCGLLFNNSFRVFTYCRNSHEQPTQGFVLDHAEYVKACKDADSKPWALVHSHPGKGAAPSPQDCKLMDAFQVAKLDLAMIIVGMSPAEVRCFKKVGDNYHLEWEIPWLIMKH